MRAHTLAQQRIARLLRAQEPPATYAEIGRQLGVTKQRAHQLVHDTDATVAARKRARQQATDRAAHRERLVDQLTADGRAP